VHEICIAANLVVERTAIEQLNDVGKSVDTIQEGTLEHHIVTTLGGRRRCKCWREGVSPEASGKTQGTCHPDGDTVRTALGEADVCSPTRGRYWSSIMWRGEGTRIGRDR
jgi:hypothetical protein